MTKVDTRQVNPGEMGKDLAGHQRAAAREQSVSRVFDSLLHTGCRASNLPMFAFLMCALPATSTHTAKPFGSLRSHHPAQNPGRAGEEAAISTGTSEHVARCPGKGSEASAGSFSTASAADCQN